MIKEILKLHNYTDDQINDLVAYIEAEEKPEDFDYKKFIGDHLTVQAELAVNRVKDTLIEEAQGKVRTETYIATRKPLINEAARILGKSKDELKDVKGKEILKLIAEKVAEEANANKEPDAYKSKFEEMQNKYFEEKDSWEAERDTFAQKIQAEIDGRTQFENNYIIDLKLNKKFRNSELIKWAYPDQVNNNIELVMRDLKDRFKLGRGENDVVTIAGADGGIATSKDGTRKYNNVDEAIVDLVKERNMWKQSNGNGSGAGDVPGIGDVLNKKGEKVAISSAIAKHLSS